MLPVFLLFAVATTWALQPWEINDNTSNRALFGDMILTPLQRQRYGKQNNPVRGVSRKESCVSRWDNNVVPYTLSTQYSEEQKRIITDSLAVLERVSCFRFVKRTTEPDFLAIMALDGCYSFVGKIGGAQKLSLAADCVADYIVWHEVMHAIGFEHEHQRPDRDDFIKVVYSNVQPGQLANFEKLSPHEVDYAENYDYESIMHYDSYAFGRRDQRSGRRLATMIPLKKGVTLEDNLKMSKVDVRKLNDLGKCSGDPGGRISASRGEGNAGCRDEIDYCGKMKKDGLCTLVFYRQTMFKFCAKSCGLCEKLPIDAAPKSYENALGVFADCRDQDHRCPTYALNGFCTDPFYVGIRATRCAQTCNLCADTTIPESPRTLPA